MTKQLTTTEFEKACDLLALLNAELRQANLLVIANQHASDYEAMPTIEKCLEQNQGMIGYMVYSRENFSDMKRTGALYVGFGDRYMNMLYDVEGDLAIARLITDTAGKVGIPVLFSGETWWKIKFIFAL